MFVYIVYRLVSKFRWEKILITTSYEKTMQKAEELAGRSIDFDKEESKWLGYFSGDMIRYAIAGYDMDMKYDIMALYKIFKKRTTK